MEEQQNIDSIQNQPGQAEQKKVKGRFSILAVMSGIFCLIGIILLIPYKGYAFKGYAFLFIFLSFLSGFLFLYRIAGRQKELRGRSIVLLSFFSFFMLLISCK